MIELRPELMARPASAAAPNATPAPGQMFERLLTPYETKLTPKVPVPVADQMSLSLQLNKAQPRPDAQLAVTLADVEPDEAVMRDALAAAQTPAPPSLPMLAGQGVDILIDDGGDTRAEATTLRPQPLAFQSGSLIDARTAPLIGGTAVIESGRPALGLSSSSSGTVPPMFATPLATAMAVPVRTASVQATLDPDARADKDMRITHAPGNSYGRGEEQSALAGGQSDTIETLSPDETEPPERRGSVAWSRTAEQRRAAAVTAVRVDLRHEQQGLAISIFLPGLDAGAAPRLGRRVEDVLAAYDAMNARVTINGSPLMRVASRGGAGHGGQRN